MTLIKRTLIIICAALLVCGIAYALAGAGLLGSAGDAGRERIEVQGAQAFDPGQQPAGRPAFEAAGGRRGGWFGLLQLGKSLAISAVIIVAVAGGAALVRRLFPHLRPRQPSEPLDV